MEVKDDSSLRTEVRAELTRSSPAATCAWRKRRAVLMCWARVSVTVGWSELGAVLVTDFEEEGGLEVLGGGVAAGVEEKSSYMDFLAYGDVRSEFGSSVFVEVGLTGKSGPSASRTEVGDRAAPAATRAGSMTRCMRIVSRWVELALRGGREHTVLMIERDAMAQLTVRRVELVA